MAIKAFSALIQDNIYKSWLKQLDKNIVTSTTSALRDREQVAAKTSFYFTENTIKQAIKTISGVDIDPTELQLIIEDIRSGFAGGQTDSFDNTIQGKTIKVNGQNAIFFESIAFKTITERITKVIDEIPEVQEGYQRAEDEFYNAELKQLQSSPRYKSLKAAQKTEELRKLQKEAKRRATFGYFFNKGHVVGVATNLAKQFRDEIAKADKLALEQKNLMIDVLDQYINKLLADDLATANLPNALNQELYARYIKDSSKYLVELQISADNIEAGRKSIAIVEELRNIFSGTAVQKDIIQILNNSPALGVKLIEGEGSPSMIDLIEADIVDTLKIGSAKKKRYTIPKTLIGKNTIKIKKPKRKTKAIASAKKLKSKLQASRKKDTVKNTGIVPELLEAEQVDLVALQNLINTLLHQQIRQNMGDGNRRDVLNYETGRFAQSAQVERLTQGRAGMITAYYTYMKYPYATFSEGGQQEFPRSRDPKLLISKSIRDIAQQQMITRMRAQLV